MFYLFIFTQSEDNQSISNHFEFALPLFCIAYIVNNALSTGETGTLTT